MDGECEECIKASKRESQQQFKEDMENEGFDVEYYCGRFYYHGYAVRCDSEDEHRVIRATKVDLKTDSMGKGLILYPS